MIGPLLIRLELRIQEIRKKEHFQNNKHEKKFNKNNLPESPPDGHPAKAVTIQVKNPDIQW